MRSVEEFSHEGGSVVPRSEPTDLSAVEIPHPNPFVCEISIDRAQVGRSVPHVSNIEYVRWLDRAAELHADSLGYSRQWLFERGMMWFVARHEIDYLAEAWPGNHLLIATWVRDMKKVKSWRDYLIIRPADRSVICQAATLWVLVDLSTRRPLRIPSEMMQRFTPLYHPADHGAEDSERGPYSPSGSFHARGDHY